MTAPSEILTQAADLIRDTAAKASPGPWTVVPTDLEWDVSDEVRGEWLRGRVKLTVETTPQVPTACYVKTQGSGIGQGFESSQEGYVELNDGAWIALLNPAVAGPIEAWLRDAARAAEDYEYWIAIPGWVYAAGELAAKVLGLENTPEESP